MHPSAESPAVLPDEPTIESERLIAWLRVALIPLIAAARTLPHPNPSTAGFYIALGIVSAYSLAALAWVYTRPVTRRFALGSTALDLAAITALVVLSGGAFSQARLAYFLIPVAVAFRFRPALTAAAGAVTVGAYLVQAIAHPAAHEAEAHRFIAVQTGFLVWLALASWLLSAVLRKRTMRMAELAEARRRLMAEAMSAEERERRSLAEGLHDSAIQNLLSARHDLDEAADGAPNDALARADAALAQTIAELREALFELHPYILEQTGLATALRALAQRSARRAGFRIDFELSYRHRHPHESVLLGVARELLANAAEHSAARSVSVRLAETNGDVLLAVRDDGTGFDPGILPQRLAEGHIGLQSQRERIENLGGRMVISAAPGRGTLVEVRVPA